MQQEERINVRYFSRDEKDLDAPRIRTERKELGKPMSDLARFLLIVMAIVGSVAIPSKGQSIAITNVRIVDGNGGPVIEHGTIVFREKMIESVGSDSQVVIPAGARRIDAGGKTALPGLADLHVHLTGGWDGETVELLGYQRYLNALLYAGVTTVLDTGNIEPFILQLRAETAAGRVNGPRIYCVGPLVDGADPFWPPLSSTVVSTDQVPRLVRGLAADKVDLIKLYAGLSDVLVRAISAEAKKVGIRTIIDAHANNGSIDLMDSGIAGFAHFPSHRLSDDAIAAAKERGIFFISTLTVQEVGTRRRFQNPSFLDDPIIADTTPKFFLDSLRELTSKPSSPEQQEARNRRLATFLQAESNVKRLKDAGVLFAAGTDAPYPGDFQGEGIHHELELLVESGLTPLEAITTATKNASTILHAANEWGTLEAGKLANILVVDGKPDQKIGDTKKVSIVIKEGTILDRGRLKLTPADPGYLPIGPISASGPS